MVRKTSSGEIFALKKLRKTDMVKKDQVAHVLAERDVLTKTPSANVVKLYYSFQDAAFLYLIMEYLQGDCNFTAENPWHGIVGAQLRHMSSWQVAI